MNGLLDSGVMDPLCDRRMTPMGHVPRSVSVHDQEAALLKSIQGQRQGDRASSRNRRGRQTNNSRQSQS